MATDTSALTASILQAAPTICQESAEALGRDIQATAPIGETGDLSREWEASTEATGDGAVSTLKFTTPYASFVDAGTRPHDIVGDPYLAFSWGGQTVIVHSVHHPGTTATNFFTDKANDDGLWGLTVQAVISGFVIQ